MAPIQLPKAFADSYHEFEKYPSSLVPKETYGSLELKAIQNRLFERAPQLLVADDKTLIQVRDVADDGQAQKDNLGSDAELKAWLGDTSQPARQNGQIATKPDPRCRFV